MSIVSIAKWIEATGPARAIAQSTWMFPAAETVHVIAIAVVVGSIAVLDLRGEVMVLVGSHHLVSDGFSRNVASRRVDFDIKRDCAALSEPLFSEMSFEASH